MCCDFDSFAPVCASVLLVMTMSLNLIWRLTNVWSEYWFDVQKLMRRRQIMFLTNSSRWESLLVVRMGHRLQLRLVCNRACVCLCVSTYICKYTYFLNRAVKLLSTCSLMCIHICYCASVCRIPTIYCLMAGSICNVFLLLRNLQSSCWTWMRNVYRVTDWCWCLCGKISAFFFFFNF